MSRNGLDAEVIVVGAGPVGSTLAALLGAANVECLLVGAAGAAPPAHGPMRALALTPASRNILDAAGAWQRLPREELGYFSRMRVWDASGAGHIEFDCAELCLPALGYIVSQSLLEESLAGALRSSPCVSTIAGGGMAALELGLDRALLRFEDGRSLVAPLIVGADGFSSGVRSLAGIDYPVHEYGQQALTCTVETTRPHAYTAWQRFLAEGPLAFLPLSAPCRTAVVWSASPQSVAELQSLDAEAFAARLAEAFDHSLGEVRLIGARGSFPLRRAHAERYCRPRFALAGDAAHCVHPLAGQGANLGLLDAASLAEVLLEARARGRDAGAIEVLRRYERWRRGENGAMVLALDTLHTLFGSRSAAWRLTRNTGLDLVDACGPLKNLIMRLATGNAGDLPLLARASLPA